jgi:hypothetical protein
LQYEKYLTLTSCAFDGLEPTGARDVAEAANKRFTELLDTLEDARSTLLGLANMASKVVEMTKVVGQSHAAHTNR